MFDFLTKLNLSLLSSAKRDNSLGNLVQTIILNQGQIPPDTKPTTYISASQHLCKAKSQNATMYVRYFFMIDESLRMFAANEKVFKLFF